MRISRVLRFGAALVLSLAGAALAEAAGRRLTASDVLQVNVVNQAELNTLVRIEPDGTISLPYVGRIRAAGLTEDELKDRVTRALVKAEVVKDPQVLIEVTTFGTQVSVLGAVDNPDRSRWIGRRRLYKYCRGRAASRRKQEPIR